MKRSANRNVNKRRIIATRTAQSVRDPSLGLRFFQKYCIPWITRIKVKNNKPCVTMSNRQGNDPRNRLEIQRSSSRNEIR